MCNDTEPSSSNTEYDFVSQLLESYGGEWYPINTQVLLRLDAATYLQEL